MLVPEKKFGIWNFASKHGLGPANQTLPKIVEAMGASTLLVATSTDVWVLISEAVSSVRVRVVTRTGGLSVTDTTLNQKKWRGRSCKII